MKMRYKNIAKKEYTNTDSELARHKEIQDMFLLFDTNNSGTFEIDEIKNMFKYSGISIDKENLMKIFKMVDVDSSGTLTFDEFKEFMLNEERQKLFSDIMKKERSIQLTKAVDYENVNAYDLAKQTDLDYLPTTADSMMRHLRFKTIRKKLYEDIFDKEEDVHSSVHQLLSPQRSQSIFDTEPYASKSQTPRSNPRREYSDKAMDDVKNFMRIFTGYNINNPMPSQNPLQEIIRKKLARKKSENF